MGADIYIYIYMAFLNSEETYTKKFEINPW
jgi:hypothetical protein